MKYIGPGFLVTVGFIDPGNWAANMAAGSQYGYTLLWMVTLSTIMLIILPLVMLTSSSRVMRKFANSRKNRFLLWTVSAIVVFLNVMLLGQIF